MPTFLLIGLKHPWSAANLQEHNQTKQNEGNK